MRVAMRYTDRRLITDVSGDWDIEQPTPRFDQLIAEAGAEGEVDSIGFDASGLGRWDSSLLAFLVQGMEYCDANDLIFESETLPDSISLLLDLARAVEEQELERPPPRGSYVSRIGRRGISLFDAFIAFVTFTGEVATGIGRVFLFQIRLRWRDFWVVVQANSSGALPVVTLISFLVGLIIAFLGAVVLQRFGAGYYVSYLVGYGMLREMGALMTGIIIAGRTGAAFAAELGSMKITEEIDALQTLGISPVDHLVVPRVLGLFLMMPFLTIYADFIGIAGGLVVAVSIIDLSATQFVGGLLTPVTLSDGLLGVFKGMVFGLVIGLSGCMRGLQAGTDAGAVGRAATSAVVTGIVLIILANAIIDWLAVILGV